LLAHYDELDRGKTYPKVAWEPKLGFYALGDAYRARDRTRTGTR